ncbi:hypothetical protein WOSG25_210110 [Weissella oryzae SG25]|uniref:Uncharacterized protein n=1 Tax=Weissella oryzae (strain DSM 25784 / JCM 18191 / LMG 30913 / SG25) TaxID=1329250 RepID=A0A069CWV5_WEIOS|nr:hypothetical protein [Weissella oryzae]GAK31954.1 hypothetical protein WOSG25_210110 [Weissella oryzae SG25]
MTKNTSKNGSVLYDKFTPLQRELMVRTIEGALADTKRIVSEYFPNEDDLRKKDIFSRHWGWLANSKIKELCDRKLLPMTALIIKPENKSYPHHAFIGDGFDLRVNLTANANEVSRKAKKRKQVNNPLEMLLDFGDEFNENDEKPLIELNFGGYGELDFVILGIPSEGHWQVGQSINCLIERNKKLVNDESVEPESVEFDHNDFGNEQEEKKTINLDR